MFFTALFQRCFTDMEQLALYWVTFLLNLLSKSHPSVTYRNQLFDFQCILTDRCLWRCKICQRKFDVINIQTVNSGLFFYLKIEFLWHEALPKNSEGTVIVSSCREIGLYGPLGGPQFYKALLDMPLLRCFFLFEFTEKIAFNHIISVWPFYKNQ